MARMDAPENQKRLRSNSCEPMQVRGSPAQEELPAEKTTALLGGARPEKLLRTNAREEK